MAYEHLTELARQWVAEQGEEAGGHLADAIRELRAVGDAKGERLLARIGQKIDLIDDDPAARTPRRRQMIRRQRDTAFDPSV